MKTEKITGVTVSTDGSIRQNIDIQFQTWMIKFCIKYNYFVEHSEGGNWW